MAKEIKMIKTRLIMDHPNNPRKDLGDLTELAESIRLHGIMQNLIVMDREEAVAGLLKEYEQTPSQIYTETLDKLKYDNAQYVVLLGHRRLAAADEACLNEVPCIIESGLTLNEQISLMLLENMQRNNLTIIEEAESFQMMLDLGDTVATVAEKTGFSESTVRRRAELAKLDRKRLQTLMDENEENGYQITLTDLAHLEKVESISERDRILKQSGTGGEIKRRVENYIRDKKRNEQEKNVRAAIEKITGKKPGKEPKNYVRWSSEWQTLIVIEENKDPEKVLKSKKNAAIVKNLPDDFFVTQNYGDISIVAKRGKKKVELTPEQKERKEKEKRLKALRKLQKTMLNEWEDWLFGVMESTGHSDKNNLNTLKEAISLAEKERIYVNDYRLIARFGGKESYEMTGEECANAAEKVENAQACAKILFYLCESMKNYETWDYYGIHGVEGNAKEHADALTKLLELMSAYGYDETTEEYLDFVYGRHELFTERTS